MKTQKQTPAFTGTQLIGIITLVLVTISVVTFWILQNSAALEGAARTSIF